MKGSGAEDGFTLLETILSFMILSIAMGVAVQTISSGVATWRRSSDLETASLMLGEVTGRDLGAISGEGARDRKVVGGLFSVDSREISRRGKRVTYGLKISIYPRGRPGPVFDFVTFTSKETE